MKPVDKIIKRLNNGFGFQFNENSPICHHRGHGYFTGGWSWCISDGIVDVGSIFPMTECLKWKRWVYKSSTGEIFEYDNGFYAADEVLEELWNQEI